MYLTAKVSEDVLYNIAINGTSHRSSVVPPILTPVSADAGSEYDALTNLRSRTQFGRPDFKAIFENVRNSIEKGAYLPGRESALVTNVGGKPSLFS